MADNKDELNILKEIARIKETISRINQKDQKYYQDILESLINSKSSLHEFQKLSADVGDELDDVRSSLDYIYKSFKDSTVELNRQNEYVTLQRTSLNKLSQIARETLEIRRGETVLDTNKLKKLIDQSTLQLKNLELVKEHANYEGKKQEAIEDQVKQVYELQKSFEKILQTDKELTKELGLAPQLLKGLDGILSKFGVASLGFKEALDQTKKMGQEAKSLGNDFNALKTYSGFVKSNLKDVLSSTNLIMGVISMVLSVFKDLDKGVGEFAKGMNMSYQDAALLDQKFNSIANSTGDINVSTKGIRESMMAIGQSLSSNALLNEKDAVAMTKFREQAGLAQDELNEMQKLTLATGGNLKDNVASMLYAAKTTALNNGVLLNEKMIMSEVAKASSATKLSLSGNPELLAKAAAQAKALGMNLEQVSSIADSLLQIESSITSELEAELLIGKNLNLEQARLYALNNDMEGLSKEIAKNFGSAAEFSKMNRIQQEAAAKAVGMSREELAKTLTDQEALKGLSGKQADDAKAALEAARARGMTEEEIKQKGVDGLMQQQSVQEKLNASVEKLKELFVSLVEPLLPVIDTLSSILNLVGMILKPVGMLFDLFGQVGSAISKLMGPLGIVGKILKGLAGIAIVFAAYKAYASLATIPIIGVPLGIAAAAAATAAGFSLLNKVKTADDMVSPGYGKRTLHGPEGAIALNDKDTVIAGTDLFPKGESKPQSSGGGSMDLSPLLAKIDEVLNAINNTNNKPINVAVNMDGKKVAEGLGNHATELGTSVNVGTSKVQ